MWVIFGKFVGGDKLSNRARVSLDRRLVCVGYMMEPERRHSATVRCRHGVWPRPLRFAT